MHAINKSVEWSTRVDQNCSMAQTHYAVDSRKWVKSILRERKNQRNRWKNNNDHQYINENGSSGSLLLLLLGSFLSLRLSDLKQLFSPVGSCASQNLWFCSLYLFLYILMNFILHIFSLVLKFTLKRSEWKEREKNHCEFEKVLRLKKRNLL